MTARRALSLAVVGLVVAPAVALLTPLHCASDAKTCSNCTDASRSDAPPEASSPTIIEPDCSACANGWCRISPATFTMGAPSDEPTRAAYSEDPVVVTLTHAFEISQYEVTVGEWTRAGLPLSSLQLDCTSDRCPVQASWYDAMTFANHLSQAHTPALAPCYELTGCTEVDGGKGTVCSSAAETGGLYDCTGYRLPTEAEWEFACRAGTTTAFYDGRVTTSAVSDPRLLLFCYDEPSLDSIGWYCTNSGHSAHAVGGKSANPWCLYDMLGNMAEWTNNGYNGQPYASSPQTDPGATLGTFSSRVRRGGPYYGPPLEATCFHRFGASPGVPVEGEGFRLVRTLPRSP